KRIRPQALEKFDYEQENYTTSLWFCEGTTSYYDLLIPLKAGIYQRQTYLKALSKDINRFLNTPGRRVQPLSESSFDAWIKLYRPHANSNNSTISYYLKGELVSLLLDLLIRDRWKNQRSLDDVLRQMWSRFGQQEVGFTEEQLREIIAEIADRDLSEFFSLYVDGTEELPFDDYLEPFGLEVVGTGQREATPYLGVTLNSENGHAIVQWVEQDSPASLGQISAGDELLAIDSYKVSAEQLSERLNDYQAGDTIEVALFCEEELKICSVTLDESRPSRYQVKLIESPSQRQEDLLQGWLGEEK
ncbi:MAG: M61 family metallopeptidase, partial [Okeania sp. SIO2D1]|nr:M61 family metallopeptidase [Okeania sp. SIO2D1]